MKPFAKKVYCPANNAHSRGRVRQGCPKSAHERIGSRSAARFALRLAITNQFKN